MHRGTDLRPGRPDLFNTRKDATKKDSASYYTWRGDERAFDAKSIKGKKKVDNPFHRIKSHGVDQSAPRHSALLLRDAWEGVANSVASVSTAATVTHTLAQPQTGATYVVDGADLVEGFPTTITVTVTAHGPILFQRILRKKRF